MNSNSKFTTHFYLLIALAVAGFGAQAQEDSTKMRGVYRANIGKIDLPTPSPAGSWCGSLVNGVTAAYCQGYDLVGNAAGWNTILHWPEVTGLCGGGDAGTYECIVRAESYEPGFVSFGSPPYDGYGNLLTVNGPGWVNGKTACPDTYALTQVTSVNILGDYKYSHTCLKS
jgi:hypothetical protein